MGKKKKKEKHKQVFQGYILNTYHIVQCAWFVDEEHTPEHAPHVHTQTLVTENFGVMV